MYSPTGPRKTIIARFDEGIFTIFVNGRIVETLELAGTLSGWDVTYPVRFGNEQGGEREFVGSIEWGEIHTRALTDAEVLALSR